MCSGLIFSEVQLFLAFGAVEFGQAKDQLLVVRERVIDDVVAIRGFSETNPKRIYRHVSVPVAVGVRNLGLLNQWPCCLRSLRLIQSNWRMADWICSVVVSVAMGSGIERRVGILFD